MKLFWTCFVSGTLLYLVIAYFFLTGMGDGSVNVLNITLWVPLVTLPPAILAGGLWLKAHGRVGLATGLLSVLAAPGLLGACFVLMMIVLYETNPGAFR